MLKMLLYVSKFPILLGVVSERKYNIDISLFEFHTLLRGGVVYMAGFPEPPLVRIGERVLGKARSVQYHW